MRNISLILKQFSRSVLLIAGLAVWGFSARAQGDAAKGEALFKAKCTACHKIESRMTGPALGPTITSETDDKWLTKWIQNNQALITAKDPKAVKIYNEYNQAAMTVFTELSDGDVANIIAYVRADWKTMQAAPKGDPSKTGGATADSGPSNLVIFGLLGVIVIAFIIILVLNRVIATLERLLLNRKGLLPEVAEEDTTKAAAERAATFKKLLKNKKLVFFFLLSFTIAGASWQWTTLWNTNVHTGYQPVQPIKYSHQLHAGTMKIDCQYCHGGAYKSKNATIPSLNVCMNCHKVVKTESPEIHKIYDALGYDPQTQKYDTTKARPIQWIRVHNLPDLAYFNHSQHVKVGGIKCQTCHGPIETMQEVKQYSPLTMKWCIQCHKRTEVNYKGNAYYDNMIQVHDRIKRGEKVTAAALGGIECGKCHY
ncbi:cytochrome c3 family protein [Mucilaginibacter paludis]|uniref:Cytochrome c class I n=1 Tax=Mucilaginibacter paludis DSM 18603 TaxID=714943 RepID=H1Y2I2_9SPHI|nr:cytochrome c3 family protein [Mucilaginibacter paludis]EHQ28030.1 cytochrome c class I [Mucilaginibacter paludis DSM 18603]